MRDFELCIEDLEHHFHLSLVSCHIPQRGIGLTIIITAGADYSDSTRVSPLSHNYDMKRMNK